MSSIQLRTGPSISPLLAVSSASAQNRWEDILPQVKVKCADQWTGDYQMQAYCIRQQRKGWEELNGDTLPTTPASPSVPTGITSPRNVGGVDDLIRIVTKYVQLYKSAPNNMVKGGLRPERGRELCSLFKGTQVKNWRGIVHSLGSNGDGNGVIEIDLGGSVSVKTMNNDFSDREYQTLIPHGSQLFKDAANLRTGQVVEFSGSLFPDPIDCFREVSLTVDGAMGEPEFLIRLSSVKHEDDAVVTPVQRREPQATNATQSASPPLTAAFLDGKNERTTFEGWIGTIDSGDYHEGVNHWAAHRSEKIPATCHLQSPAFEAGCVEAKRRLTPSDLRRRTDADFRLGWNSLP